MNYQNDIKHSYEYNVNAVDEGHNATFCFMSDGTGYRVDDYDFTTNGKGIEAYLTYVCNQVNNNVSGSSIVACELIMRNNGFSTFTWLTNKVDYVIIGGGFQYRGLYYANPSTDVLDDAQLLQNYPSYNDMNYYSYSYDYFTAQIGGGAMAVFDLSAINSEVEYYNDTFAIRGENYTFSKHALNRMVYTQGPTYFAYGQPLNDMRYSEYQAGYGSGYANGYINGVDDGYQQGLNSIGGNIGSQQATAFTYVGNAFGAVGNIMSLEILPNVTLGLCFSIPMVFVLIMTIFKLVRK